MKRNSFRAVSIYTLPKLKAVNAKDIKVPFYAKTTILTAGPFTLLTMYIEQSIIVPLVFAAIIAIVFQPVAIFFVWPRINRVVAIVLKLITTFLLIMRSGILK